MVARAHTKAKGARAARPEQPYASYVNRVLKAAHPTMAMSSTATVQLSDVLQQVAARLAAQSGAVSAAGGQRTLSVKHVQAATKLLLREHLSEFATRHAAQAVQKFAAADGHSAAVRT